MDDTIAKLRAKAHEEASEDYTEGFEAGTAWAKEEASPKQLRRIKAQKDNYEGQSLSWEELFRDDGVGWQGGASWVCYRDWIGDGESEAREADSFWQDQFGDESEEPSREMLLGFANGALSVWEQVKGHR